MKTIIFTGGGTAGHVMPNLALMARLNKNEWTIHYIGTEEGIEHDLLKDRPEVIYHAIAWGKLRRYFSWKNFTDPFRVIAGAFQSARLMKKLKPGDVLVVKSIDRLGRNYEEIIEQWRIITKEKNAAIVVLDMPLLDTRKGRDLTGTLIADIVLQLLSYVAQQEREFIRQRQAEGIAAMPTDETTGKKKSTKTGRSIGRPSISFPSGWNGIYEEWKTGKVTATKAMQRLNLKRNTFYKLVKEYEA